MKKLFAVSVFSVVIAASTAFAFDMLDRQPVKGIEGPDSNLVAFAFLQGDVQPVRGVEGPDTNVIDDDSQPDQPIRGTEGPDTN